MNIVYDISEKFEKYFFVTRFFFLRQACFDFVFTVTARLFSPGIGVKTLSRNSRLGGGSGWDWRRAAAIFENLALPYWRYRT